LDSANTFWDEGGVLAGENTDVDGVLAALARLDAPATSWLVIGTGGSARAVAAAAAARGAALAVRSRDPERGSAFLAWAGALGIRRAEPAECEVVINATPLGLNTGDALPVPAERHPQARVALDLVYAAGGTPWVRGLARRGVCAADGREMLLAQGVAAFTRWYPRVMAPIEVMRAAVDRALR
jgi:shikimate dehydrogenase